MNRQNELNNLFKAMNSWSVDCQELDSIALRKVFDGLHYILIIIYRLLGGHISGTNK